MVESGQTDLLRLFCGPHLHNTHVLVELGLDHLLDLTVELHETHIADVAQHQQDALPPQDHVVQEEDDEYDQVQDVEGHISEERPPGQVQHFPGEDCTHADHEEDVEDSWAHNRADAHVAAGDEDTNQGGEEFRGRASRCHEGGPSHIVRDIELVCNDLECRDEELIADNGQCNKHVGHAENMQDHPALSPLLNREEVMWVLTLSVRGLWGSCGGRWWSGMFRRLRSDVDTLFDICPVDNNP